MDLRTKLIFTLVAVSLGSMLVLGTFTYGAVSAMFEQTYLRYLTALAESKADDLDKMHRGWRDQVSLIGSRTQLRLSLDAWNQRATADTDALPTTPWATQLATDNPDLVRVQRIIEDVIGARAIEGIQVYDLSGGLVASAGRPSSNPPPDSQQPPGDLRPRLIAVSVPPDAPPVLTFRAPLQLEQRPLGYLLVTMDAPELAELTRDYTGLGETGEVLLARPLGDQVQILNPLRDGTPAGHLIPASAANVPAVMAATGIDTTFEMGTVDHAGTQVLAATRSVQGSNWGVVVKLSSSEELDVVRDLRDTMTTLGLSVSAFAIVIGTLLGYFIGRPIHDLAEVAKRISDGEHMLRADDRGEDEIALLARSFNHMADELVDCAAGEKPLKQSPGGAPP